MAHRDSFPEVDEILDPGGLIREAYRMESMSLPEARSIFLDWAIKLAPEVDPQIAIRRLLALYGGRVPQVHPMTQVLTEGLGSVAHRGRRQGGARARAAWKHTPQ
nr:hypothetical protein [uncultured Celeribacter sp.]